MTTSVGRATNNTMFSIVTVIFLGVDSICQLEASAARTDFFAAALGHLEAVEVVTVVAVEAGHVVAALAGRPAFAVKGAPPIGVVARLPG